MPNFYGTGASDTLTGGSGNDSIYGFEGHDFLDGASGHDFLYGGIDDDTLVGGEGVDELYGADGDDSLNGGEGNDSIYGGVGNDSLDGGSGIDNLYGGDGNDTYHVRSTTQYIQDSGGTDTVYVYANFVKLPSTIENVFYRDGALALPYWIEALLPDAGAGLRYAHLLQNTKLYYYSYPSTIPAHQASYENDKANWTAFTAAQQARAEIALRYISTIIGIDFVQSTDSSALNTITFANNDQTGSYAYAYLPNTSAYGSDLYLDSARPDNATIQDGTIGAWTLIHELGHAIGLKHPFNDPSAGASNPPYLSAAEDTTSWTVMSYEDSSSAYFLKFSPFDIAALQYLYGPSTTSRTGDDAYAVNSSSANFIWDGAGLDTLSAADADAGCTIYLTPGYWGFVGAKKADLISSSGQITINFGTVIENLTGSNHADTLYGNEAHNSISAGAGNDLLEGWAGNDTLIGGSGDDMMDGGAGVDVAVFSGDRSSYAISWSFTSESFTIQSNTEGTDTLIGIESLSFSDGPYAASVFQDTVAPTVVLLSPLDEATGTPTSSNIVVTFNEAIQRGMGNITLKTGAGLTVATYNAATSNNLSISGSTLTINPTDNLIFSTSYWVDFGVGSIKDLAGNSYAGSSHYNFTTAAAPDTTAPTIALSASQSSLTTGETATLTFTLSESSANFTVADATVTGGTLSAFSGTGSTYTALFTPNAKSTTTGVVRVASGVFTDTAGNANADGTDANNTVTMAVNTVPVKVTTTNTLSVVVDQGVLASGAVLVKNLKEITNTLDDRVQSHTVEYAGVVFGFSEIDPLITTVTRDGEFTPEFRAEIAQAYPGVENILYADAVALAGLANIDLILLGVAGFDGDFVH